MKKYFFYFKNLAFTPTAKDTYLLFAGNIGSAVWGFLFILIIARALTIEEFGVFSAANNLATILISVMDLGVSAGAVSFISEALSRNKKKTADEYIKASIIVRTISVLTISILIILFAPFVSKTLIATNDTQVAILTALLCILVFPNSIFPPLFQAKREFMRSVILDNVNFVARLVAAYLLILLGIFKLQHAFWAFLPGFALTLILSIIYLKPDFLKTKPTKEQYKQLLKFSGWVGVNRVISGIAGRLDIQMLAWLSGAATTGLYSIPQRLAMFIPVLTASYSAVLAPRMSGQKDVESQKRFLVNAFLGIVPMILGMVIMIVIAEPFIVLLFGDKYRQATPVFQALVVSYIPFMLSVPPVTAIIYAIKKTFYIGIVSIVQLVAVFLLNLVFIPKYGSLGPTVTFTIVNTLVAIYAWAIVFRFYRKT